MPFPILVLSSRIKRNDLCNPLDRNLIDTSGTQESAHNRSIGVCVSTLKENIINGVIIKAILFEVSKGPVEGNFEVADIVTVTNKSLL